MCKVSGNTAIGMNGRRISEYRTEARSEPAHLPRERRPRDGGRVWIETHC